MGIILWYAMEAGSYSIAIGTLWEVWARSFSSMFVSPLTIEEFIAGHMIFGLCKQILTVTVLSIVGYLTFHFSIFSIGITLPIHLLLLILFGNVIGMFTLGIILRFGTRLQSLAWGLIYIIQPIVGVFYPVSILPSWLQTIARMLPPTYVFESARNAVATGEPLWTSLWIAGVLNIFVLFVISIYEIHVGMGETYRRPGKNGRIKNTIYVFGSNRFLFKCIWFAWWEK